MKSKFSISIISILAVGAVLAGAILSIDTSSLKKDPHASDAESDPHASIPRGQHGGWLFSKNDLQVEVKIYEKGVPPQFRVYVADSSGKAIDLSKINLSIDLHRLDRTDEVHFKPSGEYLLGDQIIVEPHSFEVKIRAQWKGQSYQWEFSQIEARAELPGEAIKNAGIGLATAGPAQLNRILRLTGEIGLNEEKVVHIVPRLDAVVKQVFKDLGDRVKKGEILAVLESRELADAKINYLATVKQDNLAIADLERAILIFENTSRMLDLLEKNMDLEKIYGELKDLQIGESRALIIPAYAKLQLAKSVYLREKRLFEKSISSESEYLLAVANYKSLEAQYVALREKISYEGQWAVRQKNKTSEMEQLNLQTATQKLFALNLTRQEVDALSGQEEHIFTQYELRSPMAGIIIKKHLTTGEGVKKDDDVFLLADFSDVWANIVIPAKDLKNVRLGQKVLVRDDNLGIETKGELTYLDAIINKETRTVTGRVVVLNPEMRWRPGSFVSLELVLEERTVPVAVAAEAIQTIRDWSVVFVKYGNFFEARPLELGENDGHWVEVLSGLRKGEHYVTENSFAIKAEIEKSSAVHDH